MVSLSNRKKKKNRQRRLAVNNFPVTEVEIVDNMVNIDCEVEFDANISFSNIEFEVREPEFFEQK